MCIIKSRRLTRLTRCILFKLEVSRCCQIFRLSFYVGTKSVGVFHFIDAITSHDTNCSSVRPSIKYQTVNKTRECDKWCSRLKYQFARTMTPRQFIKIKIRQPLNGVSINVTRGRKLYSIWSSRHFQWSLLSFKLLLLCLTIWLWLPGLVR